MGEGLQERGVSADAFGDQLRPLTETELGDDDVWAVVDAAPDGMVMVDEEGRILLVNRRIEELFGYDRTELLGMPVETLVPPDVRAGHTAHRTRYRADPRVRAMGSGLELNGCRKDGTLFPVEISLSPVGTGDTVRVVAAVRDVTERVESEARAREIQQVLDAMPDAIFIFDRETLRFAYINNGAESHLGYPREQLLEMTPLHFKPEFGETEYRAMVDSLAGRAGSSITYTTVHRRRDGRDVPVEIVMQAATADPDGRPRLMLSLARDITERVETEERLRRAHTELETLEDRERIARDLHDTVIQRLFAAGLTLQAVVGREQDQELARRIAGTVDQLDDTIGELRSAIFDLGSRAGASHGLRERLLQVIGEEKAGLGLDPEVDIEGNLGAVSDRIAVELLPTVREALSNVARHAEASAVKLQVLVDDELLLRVVDDGVGVASREPNKGNGLRNMESRAEVLGGYLRVRAGSHSGTVLEWGVPLEQSA